MLKTVRIYKTEYRRYYHANPAGQGNWSFEIDTEADNAGQNFTFAFNGRYKDAEKAVKAEVARRGIKGASVYVLT